MAEQGAGHESPARVSAVRESVTDWSVGFIGPVIGQLGRYALIPGLASCAVLENLLPSDLPARLGLVVGHRH